MYHSSKAHNVKHPSHAPPLDIIMPLNHNSFEKGKKKKKKFVIVIVQDRRSPIQARVQLCLIGAFDRPTTDISSSRNITLTNIQHLRVKRVICILSAAD